MSRISKKELLDYMRKYKKANCPAFSTLNKKDLESLARKHGFGAATATTTAAARGADIRVAFPAGSKKEKKEKKAKQEVKEEKKEMTLEGLEKQLKNLQDLLQKVRDKEAPLNKIIDDTTSTSKQAQSALAKKNKLKDEKFNLIKTIGSIKKQIKEMKK